MCFIYVRILLAIKYPGRISTDLESLRINIECVRDWGHSRLNILVYSRSGTFNGWYEYR